MADNDRPKGRQYVRDAYTGHEVDEDMATDHNSILETGTSDSPVWTNDNETDTKPDIGPTKPEHDLNDPYSC